ncbi:hypothetical protein Tco_1106923 [Tanacetum coccineum]
MECQVLFAYPYPPELVLDHCLPQKRTQIEESNWFGDLFAFVSAARSANGFALLANLLEGYHNFVLNASESQPACDRRRESKVVLAGMLCIVSHLQFAATGRMFSAASTAAMSTFVGIYGPSKMHFLRYSHCLECKEYVEKRKCH